jgi:hypothetical protein
MGFEIAAHVLLAEKTSQPCFSNSRLWRHSSLLIHFHLRCASFTLPFHWKKSKVPRVEGESLDYDIQKNSKKTLSLVFNWRWLRAFGGRRTKRKWSYTVTWSSSRSNCAWFILDYAVAMPSFTFFNSKTKNYLAKHCNWAHGIDQWYRN